MSQHSRSTTFSMVSPRALDFSATTSRIMSLASWLAPWAVTTTFRGYLARMRPLILVYREKVVDTVTSSAVNKMQMEASPAAFCFIRYSMPETAVKWFSL